MLIFFMGSLALLVYSDAKMFRRLEQVRYDDVFHYSPLVWALWHIVLGVAVLPVYLLRRKRFKELPLAQNVTELIAPEASLEAPSVAIDRASRLASDSFGVLLFWITGMTAWMFISEIFFIYFPRFEQGIEEMTISAVVSSGWMVFLIYQATQRYQEEGFFDFVALKRKGLSIWKLAVVPMGIGIFFAVISSYIIMDRSTQPETPLSRILESTSSISWILIFISTAILLAPLLEEITFRGYFYRVLAVSKGKVFAVCLISFLFAFLHVGQYWGDWSAITMVAALGLMLALIRVWTGSTISSAITHYFYNAGVTIIPILMLLFSNPAYMEYRFSYDHLDYAAKESLLQKSIAADPSLAAAYNDLAWIYAQQGEKLDEAFILIDKALHLEPDNVAFLDTKAEIMFQLGHIDDAIAIEESIKTDDSFMSAQVEKQLKRFKEAKAAAESVN